MNLNQRQIDSTLYDAFGQEQASVMYSNLNQYHVVSEVDPTLRQSPASLKYVYVKGANSSQVPLAAFTKIKSDATGLLVNHSGQLPSITLSFNLLPGVSLGEAVVEIQNAGRDIGLPAGIRGNFSGTARVFQDSPGTMPLLIGAAIVGVNIFGPAPVLAPRRAD